MRACRSAGFDVRLVSRDQVANLATECLHQRHSQGVTLAVQKPNERRRAEIRSGGGAGAQTRNGTKRARQVGGERQGQQQ
jgi:hypothetical protein